MADENFDVNLLRWIAAELYFSLGMQALHEMYGKSYFSLGVAEKIAVDNAVGASVRANYQATTAEYLIQVLALEPPKAGPAKPTVGFQNPNPKA